LEKFSAWTGYQLSGLAAELSPSEARTKEEVSLMLEGAKKALLQCLREVYSHRVRLGW